MQVKRKTPIIKKILLSLIHEQCNNLRCHPKNTMHEALFSLFTSKDPSFGCLSQGFSFQMLCKTELWFWLSALYIEYSYISLSFLTLCFQRPCMACMWKDFFFPSVSTIICQEFGVATLSYHWTKLNNNFVRELAILWCDKTVRDYYRVIPI